MTILRKIAGELLEGRTVEQAAETVGLSAGAVRLLVASDGFENLIKVMEAERARVTKSGG